jgi:hypothetical protein
MPAADLEKAPPRTDPAPALARMVEASFLKPADRVLCYGCGRGADVAWLKRHNFDVDGYDPHPPFGYTAAPTGKYDAVLLIYLMTRLQTEERRCETIAEATGFLRPGGHLVIVSRDWARWLPDTSERSLAAAVRHLDALLPADTFLPAQATAFDPAPNSLCAVVRKQGTYRPRNPVAWVDRQEQVEEVCQRLAAEPMVGLDVETTLDEPRKLCTIQFGVPGCTWVIDALALTSLAAIRALLESPEVEKVIHNAQFEEQMFAKQGIRIVNVFDTLAASRKKYKKGSVSGHKLDDVCERELGIYLDKTLQTSDWTRRPLSPEQIEYAALDAEVLVSLYEVFHPPKPPENLELFPLA